jgi:hypothetical protein
VTATPVTGDGSLCDLAWTPGAGTTNDLTDVWLRKNADPFTAAVKQEALSPGSTRYRLERLTPGVAYKASIQHRDPRTTDTSDPIDVAFTAGATTRTLHAPLHPHEFAGSQDEAGVPRADGTYGIAVAAREVPGFVEVAVAEETAAGSGVYGAFATVAKVPSIQGDWTKRPHGAERRQEATAEGAPRRRRLHRERVHGHRHGSAVDDPAAAADHGLGCHHDPRSALKDLLRRRRGDLVVVVAVLLHRRRGRRARARGREQ